MPSMPEASRDDPAGHCISTSVANRSLRRSDSPPCYTQAGFRLRAALAMPLPLFGAIAPSARLLTLEPGACGVDCCEAGGVLIVRRCCYGISAIQTSARQ